MTFIRYTQNLMLDGLIVSWHYMECGTEIEALFLYFDLCQGVELNSLSCSFTSIYILSSYSQTSIKRSPFGWKCSLLWQMTFYKRLNSNKIFYDRTGKGWPFNTGDCCLIEVTGLTVIRWAVFQLYSWLEYTKIIYIRSPIVRPPLLQWKIEVIRGVASLEGTI